MKRPPAHLVSRVGWVVGDERPEDVFMQRGREQWDYIKSLLPADWDFARRRSLDFGCGVGRIIRHAVADEPAGEFWGTDIDAPSIAWLQANPEPTLHVRRCGEWPPLDLGDRRFGLIWSFSVFTHLIDSWSAWLLELHRLLEPDGLLIASVFGPGHESFAGEPVGEEVVGMNFLFPGARWDTGGPLVLHSRWWLEEHWGRAFEILDFRPGDQTGAAPLYGQGVLVLRRREVTLTAAELERVDTTDQREWAALRQQAQAMRREAERLMDDVHKYADSRSWRLTAPMRATLARLRPGS